MRVFKINKKIKLFTICSLLIFLYGCGDIANESTTSDVSIDDIDNKYSEVGLQSIFFEFSAINIIDGKTLGLGLSQVKGKDNLNQITEGCLNLKVISHKLTKEQRRIDYSSTMEFDYGVGCYNQGVNYAGKLLSSISMKSSGTNVKVSYDIKCTNFYSDKLQATYNGNLKTSITLLMLNFINKKMNNQQLIPTKHTISNLSVESNSQKIKIINSEIETECSGISFNSAQVGQINIKKWLSKGIHHTYNNQSYQIEMMKEVIFKNCSKKTLIPVQGEIKVTVNNVSFTIDFGNGDCDMKFTISNGKVIRELSFRNYQIFRKLLDI